MFKTLMSLLIAQLLQAKKAVKRFFGFMSLVWLTFLVGSAQVYALGPDSDGDGTPDGDQAVLDAFSAGETSLGLAVTGVIGLAAIMTGLYFVIKLLAK